ncbi:MAG: hypothetical protein OXH38_01965 [Chloroflexi bacterium]|nr:hypothetical protein [Chloroflexota bacterium]
MVTTSAAPAAAPVPWLAERDSGAGVDERQSRAAPAEASTRAVACTILTPSGALLARAMVRPRPASLPADSYAVEVSEVRPQGALEPLLRTNPQVVLRMPHEAQLALRIDHILGPRQHRVYYLQTLSVQGD